MGTTLLDLPPDVAAVIRQVRHPNRLEVIPLDETLGLPLTIVRFQGLNEVAILVISLTEGHDVRFEPPENMAIIFQLDQGRKSPAIRIASLKPDLEKEQVYLSLLAKVCRERNITHLYAHLGDQRTRSTSVDGIIFLNASYYRLAHAPLNAIRVEGYITEGCDPRLFLPQS